jgi:dihydroxy-acid dehydratase
VHTLVNLMPNGKYLMEDFCYAAGLPAVLRELGENKLLNREALTVNGQPIWDNVRAAECWNRDVIHTFRAPFKRTPASRCLRGNLAPTARSSSPPPRRRS